MNLAARSDLHPSTPSGVDSASFPAAATLRRLPSARRKSRTPPASRLLEEHASTRLAPASLNSRPNSNSCGPNFACANANSLAARRSLPRLTHQTRLPSSPPPNRHVPAVNNGAGPVRPAAITAIYPSSCGNWNCQPTSNSVRSAASRSRPFPAPPTANCWSLKSAPTAAAIADTAIAPPARAVVSPASSPHPVPPNSSPNVNWACPSG